MTADELEQARAEALANSVQGRRGEGVDSYRAQLTRCVGLVLDLFDKTDDLRNFDPTTLVSAPELVEAARFLCAPPISADDLNSLSGYAVAKRKQIDLPAAGAAASVLRALFDPVRLPWVANGGAASQHDKRVAVMWTAGLWAAELQRTARRTTESRRQKDAVFGALKAAGFTEQPRRRALNTLDELPRGTFCDETLVDGAKCDVPVRLLDGRLLAIECKVSNSAINSVKRLLRETGNKAERWRDAFGQQALPAAVLSGVYRLGNLVEAQDTLQITIFWEHDLQKLGAFVTSAR